MFFTQDDYKKIQQWLIKNSVKDTEFNEANIPFNGEETITIVQGNQNKKVFLKDLIAQVFNLGISDFVNITDKYDAPNINLEEAIRLIPSRARKEGQVITFLDREDHWHIYQFKGVLNQWNILDTWEDLFDWEEFIIDSILPDEEDLTKSLPDVNGNSYLSLKDRAYNPEDFSGLGRIILRKNIVEVEDPIYGKVKKNSLYQDMFTQSNTIYEIRYDYDLNGEEITIPEGCVLDFQGGSFSNGAIAGNNTYFTKDIKCFCSIKGTYLNDTIHLKWFAHEGNIVDDIFQTFINNNCKIIIDEGMWYVSKMIHLKSGTSIVGHGIKSIIKPTNSFLNTNFAIFGTDFVEYNYKTKEDVILDNIITEYTNITIKNITFELGRTQENTSLSYDDFTNVSQYAILFYNCENSVVKNCKIIDKLIPNVYDTVIPAIYVVQSKNCKIENCKTENITFLSIHHAYNCLVCNNEIKNSIGSSVETYHGHDIIISNNVFEIVSQNVSILSVNTNKSIVKDNYIKSINYNNITCVCIGHSDTFIGTDGNYSDANHCIIANNTLISEDNRCVLIQSSNFTIIENNVINYKSTKSTYISPLGIIDIRSKGIHNIASNKITSDRSIVSGAYIPIFKSANIMTLKINNNDIYGGALCEFSNLAINAHIVNNNIDTILVCPVNSGIGSGILVFKDNYIHSWLNFTKYIDADIAPIILIDSNIVILYNDNYPISADWFRKFIVKNNIFIKESSYNRTDVILSNGSLFPSSLKISDIILKDNLYDGIDYIIRITNSSNFSVLNQSDDQDCMKYTNDSSEHTLSKKQKGTICFKDNKPIWWTGTKWVDATGADA